MPEEVFTQLSWFRRERVAQARVMVVGCGALGNEVLKNLVLFGVQHLTVVDFDHVEAPNLSRSILFTHEDADEHARKTDAVARSIRRINPSAEVVTLFGDVAYDVGLGWFRSVDVVIGCVDNRWARYCINRQCMRAGVPWVDGGIDGLEGTARVFIPGQNCYACNLGPEGLREMHRRLSCTNTIRINEAAGRVPTTPVIASVIGAVQAQEAMKLIHKEQLEQGELTSLCGKMFCYEGQHLTTRTVNFRAWDDDCPVHTRWTPVEQVPLTNRHTVSEAMDILRTRLQNDNIRISLTRDCFVDCLVHRTDNSRIEVMTPKHKISGGKQIDNGQQRIAEDYYVNEFYEIDGSFPYPELTLARLGIPSQDVLPVHTDTEDHYVELIG
jgi:adenylyltransferase/sulfurtransferase